MPLGWIAGHRPWAQIPSRLRLPAGEILAYSELLGGREGETTDDTPEKLCPCSASRNMPQLSVLHRTRGAGAGHGPLFPSGAAEAGESPTKFGGRHRTMEAPASPLCPARWCRGASCCLLATWEAGAWASAPGSGKHPSPPRGDGGEGAAGERAGTASPLPGRRAAPVPLARSGVSADESGEGRSRPPPSPRPAPAPRTPPSGRAGAGAALDWQAAPRPLPSRGGQQPPALGRRGVRGAPPCQAPLLQLGVD